MAESGVSVGDVVRVTKDLDRDNHERIIAFTAEKLVVFPLGPRSASFSQDVELVRIEHVGARHLIASELSPDEVRAWKDAPEVREMRMRPCEGCGGELTVGRVERLVRIGYLRPTCKKCQEGLNEKHERMKDGYASTQRRPGR